MFQFATASLQKPKNGKIVCCNPSHLLQKWQIFQISTVSSIVLQENPVPRITSCLPMVWTWLLVFVCPLEWLFLVENRANSDTFNGSTSLLGPGRTWHHPAACRKGKPGAPMGRGHLSAAGQWGSFCRMPNTTDAHLQEKKLQSLRMAEWGNSHFPHSSTSCPDLEPQKILPHLYHIGLFLCAFSLPSTYSWSPADDFSVTSHYLTAALGHFPRFFAVLCCAIKWTYLMAAGLTQLYLGNAGSWSPVFSSFFIIS